MTRIGLLCVTTTALLASAAAAQQQQVGTVTTTTQSKIAVPETHRVVEGDTLWDITGRYYGDPYRWPQVWSYNPDITNPHWIYPESIIVLRPSGESFYVEARPGFVRTQTGGQGPQPIYLAEYGFLDADALKEAGYIIAANEETMMMTDTDEVYIRLEEEAQPDVGGTYVIFREIQEFEREPTEKGTLIRILGEVRLRDYDQDKRIGRATIVQSLDPIERGYKVAPFKRQFAWVDVVPADRTLRGRVVASLYPRKLLATNQMVFVDLGAENGVKLGNRFFIIRQGDEWQRSAEVPRGGTARSNLGRTEERGRRIGGKLRNEVQTTVPVPKQPEEYPWEVVAIGRVVNVRPKTSAVMLTEATRAVRMGDFAELRTGQ